ncbi:hypothetical protein Tco_0280086, partial [Tanacetum coccineum]
SECKKAGKRHLFAEEWEIDDVDDEDYEETLIFDNDPQYKEEVLTVDVGMNLVVRHSCLTPKAVGDDWLLDL